MDVVGLMAGHQLIATYPIQHGMHDGPLGRGGLPPPLGLRLGQAYRLSDPEVSVQPAVTDIDAAPDNRTGLTYSAQRTTTQPEIHGRLSPAAGRGVAAIEMRRGHRP